MFSAQVIGQDKTPDFDELSLEQLQNIDEASLSKSERRAHKKAIRAAKKASKKRKREIAKTRKRVDKVTRKTTVQSLSAGNVIMVVGPWKKISSNLFGELLGDVMPKYQLASLVDPNTGHLEFKLSVTASYHDRATDPITGKPVYRQHADTTGIWPSFYSAATERGDFRSVQRLSRYASPCNSNGCLYTETVSVALKVEDIQQPLSSGKGLRLSVNSRTGQHQVIEIPFHYLQGVGTKVADAAGGNSTFSEVVLRNSMSFSN